ncbi:MAG: hypothetical protein F6K63_13235 [Moorea sp. SIO1G6]|uniref:Uncharacterized protein n=1 Tax=Moorena producens (strain JHB) TaxID=1454205 RepID=A0A9Q9ST30_MOOP1|nr:hypothetical protein [Moorena producens]NET65288.1 hypothetical protein [Moorena sp. SIO1G6]WAN69149.1 hypothetical protein BJP36_43105 [Moorena producens JHB]
MSIAFNQTTLAKRPRYANNQTTLAKRPRYANNQTTLAFGHASRTTFNHST